MKRHEYQSHEKLRAEHARLRLAYMTLYQQHLDLLDCMKEFLKGESDSDGQGQTGGYEE